MKTKKFKTKEPIAFTKLIPNLITLMGLVIGVSSIRFALDSKWEHAVCCIVVAGIFDGIDGRVARLFNATSNFGAELDSLCDFANFGLSPAIIIYLWSFQQYEFKLISWAVILLFVVCMAIRLARFNTSIFYECDSNIHSKYFSLGVPAPSGAILSLMPIMLDFEITTSLGFNIRSDTLLIDIYVILIAMLLPSRLPTFLFKNIKIKPRYILLFFIFSAILIINTLVYPWITLPVLGLLYILSIPCCILIDKKIKQK
ncbi:MAG: CDP-alcohol phosphatidyltransferase family protein [Janthinobacterium lividum]